MYKTGMSLILIVLLSLVLSAAVFAGIQLNPVEKGDIILNEPQIGSEKQVFIKDHLAISIRSEGDLPIDVSLYKIMPSARDPYLDEACESEVILKAEDVPFKVISGSGIVARDAAIDLTWADSETTTRFEELIVVDEDALDPANIIDGSEAFLQKNRPSSKERQAVIKAYNKALRSFEKHLEDLSDLYDEYLEMFPEGHTQDHEYTEEELDSIESYLIAVEETQSKCQAFKEARVAYEAIFEIPLFGPEAVTANGVLPYYENTVENISPGFYKFVFSDEDTREIIEVIEFEVSKKEELTEEDIKDAMPDTIGELINTTVDIKLEESEELEENEPKNTESEELEENELKNTESEELEDNELKNTESEELEDNELKNIETDELEDKELKEVEPEKNKDDETGSIDQLEDKKVDDGTDE